MNTTDILIKQAEILADFFKKELQNELEQQGHRDTGKLIDSIEYEILTDADAILIAFSYLGYGDIVNDGVRPSNIPFSPNSGAKSSKYIDALKNWAKRKGFKKPLSAAFAIAHKHKKEGMPTKNSYKFSSNGRRKYWKSFTLNQYLDKSLEIMSSDVDDLIALILKQS